MSAENCDSSPNSDSSGSFSFCQMTESDYAKVIFYEVEDSYAIGEDIDCIYQVTDSVTPHPCDYLGLFRVGWQNASECLVSQSCSNAYSAPCVNGVCDYVVFKANDLPKDTTEFYQFLYLTTGDAVCGASTPFRLEAVFEADEQPVLIPAPSLEDNEKKAHSNDAVVTALQMEKDMLQAAMLNLEVEINNLKIKNQGVSHAYNTLQEELKVSQSAKKHVMSFSLRSSGGTSVDSCEKPNINSNICSPNNVSEVAALTDSNRDLQVKLDAVKFERDLLKEHCNDLKARNLRQWGYSANLLSDCVWKQPAIVRERDVILSNVKESCQKSCHLDDSASVDRGPKESTLKTATFPFCPNKLTVGQGDVKIKTFVQDDAKIKTSGQDDATKAFVWDDATKKTFGQDDAAKKYFCLDDATKKYFSNAHIPNASSANDSNKAFIPVDFSKKAFVPEDTTKKGVRMNKVLFLWDSTMKAYVPGNVTKEVLTLDNPSKNIFILEDASKKPFVLEHATKNSFVPEGAAKEVFAPEDATKKAFVPEDAAKEAFVPEDATKKAFVAVDVAQNGFGRVAKKGFGLEDAEEKFFDSWDDDRKMYDAMEDIMKPFYSEEMYTRDCDLKLENHRPAESCDEVVQLLEEKQEWVRKERAMKVQIEDLTSRLNEAAELYKKQYLEIKALKKQLKKAETDSKKGRGSISGPSSSEEIFTPKMDNHLSYSEGSLIDSQENRPLAPASSSDCDTGERLSRRDSDLKSATKFHPYHYGAPAEFGKEAKFPRHPLANQKSDWPSGKAERSGADDVLRLEYIQFESLSPSYVKVDAGNEFVQLKDVKTMPNPLPSYTLGSFAGPGVNDPSDRCPVYYDYFPHDDRNDFDIFEIPCPVCEERIPVFPEDTNSMSEHLLKVHDQQLCPVCGRMFDRSLPPNYFKFHVENHFLDEDGRK